MDHIVYKISSDLTTSTYYGYCNNEDILAEFLKGAQRTPDAKIGRGSIHWFTENDRRTDNIEAEVVDVFKDEIDAWCSRNDHRSADVFSITGPTVWPSQLHRRIKKESPELINTWKKRSEIQKSTARKAMQHGAFTFIQMKELGVKHGRDQVVKDMDSLTARQFSEKYDIPVTIVI